MERKLKWGKWYYSDDGWDSQGRTRKEAKDAAEALRAALGHTRSKPSLEAWTTEAVYHLANLGITAERAVGVYSPTEAWARGISPSCYAADIAALIQN